MLLIVEEAMLVKTEVTVGKNYIIHVEFISLFLYDGRFLNFLFHEIGLIFDLLLLDLLVTFYFDKTL